MESNARKRKKYTTSIDSSTDKMPRWTNVKEVTIFKLYQEQKTNPENLLKLTLLMNTLKYLSMDI